MTSEKHERETGEYPPIVRGIFHTGRIWYESSMKEGGLSGLIAAQQVETHCMRLSAGAIQLIQSGIERERRIAMRLLQRTSSGRDILHASQRWCRQDDLGRKE
jgi:hypothetical protein